MENSKPITEKIISDAVRIANSTREEGNVKAQEIIEKANNDVRIFRQKNMEETFAMRDEIVRRRISVANLEVKKLLLAAKTELLNATFGRALDAIGALPQKQYLGIIEGMLSVAEDGDLVRISKNDAKTVTAEFIAGVAKKRGIKLTLAKDYADIKGGIILSNGRYDKNLALETELGALREEIEPEIALKLFGEKH